MDVSASSLMTHLSWSSRFQLPFHKVTTDFFSLTAENKMGTLCIPQDSATDLYGPVVLSTQHSLTTLHGHSRPATVLKCHGWTVYPQKIAEFTQRKFSVTVCDGCSCQLDNI